MKAISSRVPEQQIPFTSSPHMAQGAARGTSLYALNNKTLPRHTVKMPDFSANTLKDICGTQPPAKATSGQEGKGAHCYGALLQSEKGLTQKHLGCHCGSDWCWECFCIPFSPVPLQLHSKNRNFCRQHLFCAFLAEACTYLLFIYGAFCHNRGSNSHTSVDRSLFDMHK